MLRRVRAAGTIRRQPKIAAGGHALRRPSSNATRLYGRRSVVKASFRRNRHNGGWTAHERYLARENAQRANERNLRFDAVRDGLDPVATVRDWEHGDQLMWSFIVSPEDADRIDLNAHVRDLVAEMERDLDTRLEWIAIDHHNTDDSHVHLLVRGVREDDRPLEIDREYLKHGLRELSERLIERKQWTEIDRALKRRAGFDRVVTYEHIEPATRACASERHKKWIGFATLKSSGLRAVSTSGLGSYRPRTKLNCVAASASATSSRPERSSVSGNAARSASSRGRSHGGTPAIPRNESPHAGATR
jgi:ribosomal protein S18 acetylase RimI-like enzyme